MSEEQKIIDLENEISFLKDILNEKENDFINEIKNRNDNFISKDKIRELLNSKDVELTGVISYRELEKLLKEK